MAWLRGACFTLGGCLASANFVLKIQYDTDASCDVLCSNVENYSGVQDGLMTTIYDAAACTGVSPKAVSRVINGDAAVSDTTREKVETATAALDYIPSSAAWIMCPNRSGLVRLITGTISRTGEAFCVHGLPDMFLIKSIRQQVRAAGKTLMIVDAANRADQIEPLTHTFMERRVEDTLYVAEYHQEVALPEITNACPIVLINRFDTSGTLSVLPDDEQGQYNSVRQIVRHGHTRIAYVILPPGIETTRLRIQGYRHALEGVGIAFDPEPLQTGYPDHSNDSEPLLAAILCLTAPLQPPSVTCCSDDEMAVRVYGILRTRGLRMPEQALMVGYDNHSAITETSLPPLTSTELPYMRTGASAADMLLGVADGKKETGHIIRVTGKIIWQWFVVSLK